MAKRFKAASIGGSRDGGAAIQNRDIVLGCDARANVEDVASGL